MPDMLLSALTQAPFVLVMAYLVQRFLAHMDERDREWQAALAAMAAQLEDLSGAIREMSNLLMTHDALTRQPARLAAQPIPKRRVR